MLACTQATKRVERRRWRRPTETAGSRRWFDLKQQFDELCPRLHRGQRWRLLADAFINWRANGYKIPRKDGPRKSWVWRQRGQLHIAWRAYNKCVVLSSQAFRRLRTPAYILVSHLPSPIPLLPSVRWQLGQYLDHHPYPKDKPDISEDLVGVIDANLGAFDFKLSSTKTVWLFAG